MVPVTTPETTASINVLVVQVADQWIALPAHAVREIARYRPWTPVPGAPHALPGVISMRGAIVPVVELRGLLGMADEPAKRTARLVMLHVADTDFAVYTDAVDDLAQLDTERMIQLPIAPNQDRPPLLTGLIQLADREVALLDLTALLALLRQL